MHRDTFRGRADLQGIAGRLVGVLAPCGAAARELHRSCPRAFREDVLMAAIQQRVWLANIQVYGAVKVWRQLARESTAAARCTVERLMRRLGLRGVMRGKVNPHHNK